MSTASGDMLPAYATGEGLREYHLSRRRALLAELAAEEGILGLTKPVIYLPEALHPTDEQLLSKYFRIVHARRTDDPRN